MEKRLFARAPALPTCGVIECFLKRRAKLIDRSVKPKLLVRIAAVEHGFREGSIQTAIVSGRGLEIRWEVEGVLACCQVHGVMAPAGIRTHRVDAAVPILQKRANDVPRRVLVGRQWTNLFRMSSEVRPDSLQLRRISRSLQMMRDEKNLVSIDFDSQ